MIHASVIAIVLFFTILLIQPAALSYDEQDVPEKVYVGVYENYPKIYVDETGNVNGFWADLMNYIGEQEGWEIYYVTGYWEEGLERLGNNDIDMLVDAVDSTGGTAEAGEMLYKEILAVASGKKTKAELLNYGNFPNIFTIGPVI